MYLSCDLFPDAMRIVAVCRLACPAEPVAGIAEIALDEMAKGVDPVQRLLAFAVLADFVSLLPFPPQAEMAFLQPSESLFRLRKVVRRGGGTQVRKR